MAESRTVGQPRQLLSVLIDGRYSAILPTTLHVAIGPAAAGDLRPRKVGLHLEPFEMLRMVVGQDVGDVSVPCALLGMTRRDTLLNPGRLSSQVSI